MSLTAAFSLKSYKFTKAILDMNVLPEQEEAIDPVFIVEGQYNRKEGEYTLSVQFQALTQAEEIFVEVHCTSVYKFQENVDIEDLPDFFYGNALAIIFPYIRSFVSTLTLQANFHPFLLPTMNLSKKAEEVKRNTIVV